MSEYIKVDILRKEYNDWYKLFTWGNGTDAEKATIARAIQILNEQPTADVAKVVRCKNCMDWQTDWTPYCFEEGAYHFCGTIDTVTNAEDFSSKGEERKELI